MDTTFWGYECRDLDMDHRPKPKSEIYMPCLIRMHHRMEMKETPGPWGLEIVHVTVSAAMAVAMAVIFLLIPASFSTVSDALGYLLRNYVVVT